MKPPKPRRPFLPDFFGLTQVHALKRTQWIFLFYGLIWVILSGLQIGIHFVYEDQRTLAIVPMSFLKYLPILLVPLVSARAIASKYLTNILELKDIKIAEKFIAFIAFGTGSEKIIIGNGHINQDYLDSPILQIGGPGYVQVNLDNVAVFEKPDGEPHILYPQPKLWKLDGFERLREIGSNSGKDKYAVINLKDHFIANLTISARTKDGIPIEAHDIKIIFSVTRKQEDDENVGQGYSVSEEAVQSLVYKQTVPVDASRTYHPQVGFPWDSSILPLVQSELEDLIMKHTLGEILASIGQKEADQTIEVEQQINKLKGELTGQHPTIQQVSAPNIPDFQSRSKITAQFYEPSFKMKASELGVSLLWIDIGTWILPSAIILDKHKEAWDLSRENASKMAGIERKIEIARQMEFMRLINDVALSRYKKTLRIKELEGISLEKIDLKKLTERDPMDIAKEILRAFRKELLAGQKMFISSKETAERNRHIIDAIHKAITEINYFTESHPIK